MPILQEKTLIAKFYGRSMQPTLKEGMHVLIERMSPEDIRLADIILYRENGSLVSHRVIRILRKQNARIFITKGDNHAYIDCASVAENAFLGKVRAAFDEENPQKNLLIENRLLVFLYVIMGNAVYCLRNYRKFMPELFRIILRPFVGSFFLGFKKFTRLIYLLSSYTSFNKL